MTNDLPPIGLRLSKHPLYTKGKRDAAAVYGGDPHTIVLSRGYDPVAFYRDTPGGFIRELVRLLNHETLHAAMKRAGIREWGAIDRFISYRKEDFRWGLCNPGNAIGFAKDGD